MNYSLPSLRTKGTLWAAHSRTSRVGLEVEGELGANKRRIARSTDSDQ